MLILIFDKMVIVIAAILNMQNIAASENQR